MVTIAGKATPISHGGTGAVTSAGARINLGLGIGTTVQAWDADLDALSAITGTGFAVRTADDTWALRSLVAPAAGLTITNNTGVSGNPTFELADDLAALEGLGSTGFAVRSAANTWIQRTITGTTAEITVVNGDGVSGNPVISLPSEVNITRLRLTATDDTGLATTLHGFQIGPSNGINIAMDTNEIMARNNGVASTLHLNADGGLVTVGANTAANLQIGGLIDLQGGQIQFPATQNASSDPNTLDEYEEGTWTPTVVFGGASTGITYSIQSGNYIKIGRLVTVWLRVQMSNKGSATSNMGIQGLPFSMTALGGSPVGFATAFTGLNGGLHVLHVAGTTGLGLYHFNGAGTGYSQVLNTNATNTSRVDITSVYLES